MCLTTPNCLFQNSPTDMGSEGGTLVRRRTLKESLRRSFRRLRSGRRSGRRRHSSKSGRDAGQQSPTGEQSPVQRLIDESSKVGEGYQGLVRCLYMVDTFLKDGKCKLQLFLKYFGVLFLCAMFF